MNLHVTRLAVLIASIAWAGDLKLVRFHGRIYELYLSDGARPTWVDMYLPHGRADWICTFKSQAPTPTLSAMPHEASAAPICAEVQRRLHTTRDDFAFAPPNAPTQLPLHYLGDSTLAGVALIDVMNDGHQRQVRAVTFDSGAGEGCATAFYDTADPQAATALRAMQRPSDNADAAGQDVYPVRAPNGYAVCHGNLTRFHTISGKVVLEARFSGDAPERVDQEYWWVSTVRDGHAVRLCEARSFARHDVIDAINPALAD